MKKLGIFVDSLKRDGAERVSVNLAKYMVSRGIETTIITEWISENEYDVPKGVKRVSIDSKKDKYKKYPYNIWKMRKAIMDSGIDTLLVMDLPGSLIAIPASRGMNVKVVVSERNDPTHFPGKQIVAKVSRWLMSKADGFVYQTKEAQEFYKGITNGRGVVIPNPLFVESMPEPYMGEKRKYIVTAGRLTEQKNQMMLIEAFALFNKSVAGYNLIIYGEGALKKDLENAAVRLGVEKQVSFPGNKKDLLYRIKDASLFVMTSNFEGMPNALLEAMALGLPVISTDCPCGGPRAVIDNNINGILIEVGDTVDCAEKMKQVLTDEQLGRRLGEKAILIRKRLDSNSICEKWMRYLENV